MTYEAKEGVDYIIDLYAVAGAEQGQTFDELRQRINQRLFEYHPDRLQGLAPEFLTKGERMAQLLNRAKTILLDPQKKDEYDEVLTEWTGPVSKDGTPIITLNRQAQAEMEGKTPEVIEDTFTEQTKKLEEMAGYTPTRLSFLEKIIAQSGDEIADDLRAQYEDALLQYDRVLAIQEAERSQLLSLPDRSEEGYRVGVDYADTIIGNIEAAREERKEELRMLAIGGVSTRLALLAGESAAAENTNLVDPLSLELPAYFDQQAEKVVELAKARQGIVEKRLDNFQPTYPETEMQSEAQPNIVIGIGDKDFRWFGVVFDAKTNSASMTKLKSEILEQLEAGDYKSVIRNGYNILTLPLLEQIDFSALLATAIEKYAEKFGLMPDDNEVSGA